LDSVNGGAEVWLDTGILSGGDIVAAIARGADACLIGRAYLYGLMAGGERGVQRCVDILRAEIIRTMQLLGVRRLADLRPTHDALSASSSQAIATVPTASTPAIASRSTGRLLRTTTP